MLITKHLKFLFLFSILLSLLLVSCKHRNKIIEESPHWFEKYTFFDNECYSLYCRTTLPNLINDTLPFRSQIIHYYQANQPIWTIEGFQEHKIQLLLSFFQNSTAHGLHPEMFHYSEINYLIDSLKTGIISDSLQLYATLLSLEVDLTENYLLYSKMLQFGATNPAVVNSGKWFHKVASPDTLSVHNALWASDTLNEYLLSIQKKDSNYVALQSEIVKYLKIKDSTFKTIPVALIDSHAISKSVSLIAKRLQITGELASSYHPNDTLDETLLKAVNLFRANNAIPANAQIDEETIRALNRNFQYYIDKLTVNLERNRWKILPAKDSNFIVVNLPDFTMKTYFKKEFALEMKVCCGKTLSNPDSVLARTQNGIIQAYYTESPLLSGVIDQVVFNPEWFVPSSIIKDEYYNKLVRNNTAIIKKEKLYVVNIKTKEYVVPDSINWLKVDREKIPYRLIQSSGRHNSLGRIKFNFYNPEYVYLHDTNNKGAFKKRNRALSHGCVRLENPLELAMIIFELNEYSEEDLEKVMIDIGELPTTDEGKEYLEEKEEKETEYYESLSDYNKMFYRKLRPSYYTMEKQMFVYFEYYTAFLHQNGYVQYRNDVYFKDQNILNELNKLM